MSSGQSDRDTAARGADRPPHPATIQRGAGTLGSAAPGSTPPPATVAQRRAEPHPATVAQRRAEPHPATVAQRRAGPHPATVAQRRAELPPTPVAQRRAAPHPATVAQRRAEPHPPPLLPGGQPPPTPAQPTLAETTELGDKAPIDLDALVRDAEARWQTRGTIQRSLVARSKHGGFGGGGRKRGGDKKPPPFDLKHIRKARLKKRLRYHVTRVRHFLNILARGLQPRFGGRGGASEAVGERQFIRNSRGHVHIANNVGLARFYYNVLLRTAQNALDMPIVFAIRRDVRFREELDPDDDRGAFRVQHVIRPSDIIVLEATDIGFQRDDDEDYVPDQENENDL